MKQISDKLMVFIKKTGGKRGEEMVEAGIAMPIVILVIMLMIRLFTFYLQILNTGIGAHEKALEEWDQYDGKLVKVYTSSEDVEMIRGGILGMDLHKQIEVKAYFLNEDVMVRAGEIVEE